MTHYERILAVLTENQSRTDSRLSPGHSKRMKDHEERIQRELEKPENQDELAHSEETKKAARKIAKAREAAKRKVSEGAGGPSSSKERIPAKRPAGYGQTERPSNARIQAMQAKVAAYYAANPEAEGAAKHSERGPEWQDKPRKQT